MKFLFLLLLMLPINPVKDLNKVAEINSLKEEAKEAYTQGKYDQAIDSYEKLIKEFGITDDNVAMNLAHSYFKNGTNDKAKALYNNLSKSKNETIRSIAYNQLGVLANAQKKKEEAINYFKEALKADPSNEAARFNYSKLKKEKEQKQQQQNKNNKNNKNNKDQNNDQQNKDQQQKGQNKKDQQQQQNKENKEQQGKSEKEQQKNQGEQEKKEQQQQNQEQQQKDQEQQAQQKSTAEKLKEMNMTKEKAEMILEAMRNNEIQYIQQNRKKPKSNVDDGKPDW